MVDCNKQATGKTGDDRKTFMSTCLKGDTTAAAPAAKQTQQEKMKSCNAEAGKEKLSGRRAQDVHEHVPQGRRARRRAH